jgi:hypothetical protein
MDAQIGHFSSSSLELNEGLWNIEASCEYLYRVEREGCVRTLAVRCSSDFSDAGKTLRGAPVARRFFRSMGTQDIVTICPART